MLLGAGVGAAAASLLLKGDTPPVRAREKGEQPAESIAELEQVQIGGTKQWVLMRSEDIANPVLLILHGGPGTAEMALHRQHKQELERYFTVVNWDQRGAGKSYGAGSSSAGMTIAQMVEDTRELAQYLLRRFRQKRIILMGRSWGSALGMLTISKYPELFSAYVGLGQISDTTASELLSYRWTLEQAVLRNDTKAVQALQEMGPPPYSGDWLSKFNEQRKYVCKYGGEVMGNSNGGNVMLMRSVLTGREYTVLDRINYYRGVKRSLRLIQPQLMDVNLFRQVPEVKVPVFFTEGRHDQVVPVQLAYQYYEALEAPHKEWIWFEESAHMPDFEEREHFNRVLIDKVRPVALQAAEVLGELAPAV
jgi:pimeloyl-ACP methyl ester carboxylesterase